MPANDDNRPAVYGLILAGGRSARMGEDKWALDVRGEAQVQYCSTLLAGILDRVYISLRPDQDAQACGVDAPCIVDQYDNTGPMSGVVSAMDKHPEAAWLVMACDLPLLDARAIRMLLDGRDPARMCTAFMASDGFFEPLCAIYEPGIAPLLRERMQEGRYSLRDVLTDCDVRLLCAPDDRILLNVNTPEDLAMARAWIASGEADA